MVLDIITLVFLIAGFYYGYKKGIINTLFMLLCFFIGTTVLLKCNEYMLHYLGTPTPVDCKSRALNEAMKVTNAEIQRVQAEVAETTQQLEANRV